VHSEEKLRRMVADGVLTPSQAARLRESLNWNRTHADEAADSAHRPARKAVAKWLLAVVGAALVIALLVLTIDSGVDNQAPQDVATTLNEPGGIGQMNKSFSGLLAIALFLIVPLLLWILLHNSLVTKEEAVFEAWAQTESNLQRRAALIPALVDTVSRYLRHESETLTSVTGQRSDAELSAVLDELIAAHKASAELVQKDGSTIVESDADLAALYAAQQSVGQRMHSFLAVAESYPQLHSSDQFLELQAQLEGTENRINVARMRFNESVAAYNASIRKLPGSLVASVGSFDRKAYFQADEASHNDPELAFD
jgi:LemA protein